MKTVIGLFDTTRDAKRALDELSRIGYSAQNISIVTNENAQPSMAPGVRFESMRLKDVGTVVAWGPLRQALMNGAHGNLRSALSGLGLSATQADQYATGVEHGGTLESVVVLDSDADKAAAAMRHYAADRTMK